MIQRQKPLQLTNYILYILHVPIFEAHNTKMHCIYFQCLHLETKGIMVNNLIGKQNTPYHKMIKRLHECAMTLRIYLCPCANISDIQRRYQLREQINHKHLQGLSSWILWYHWQHVAVIVCMNSLSFSILSKTI